MDVSSIAVAILNWNGIDLLKQFLPSVISHSGNAEIIVIDNASTDHSVSWLKSSYPEVRLIQLDENLGYAGGYNEAIGKIEKEYIVLLNSDVETSQDWLNPILNRFASDERIAAIQPKILSFHQKDYFEYAGAAGGFMDYLGYPFCRGRIFNELEKDEGQYDEAIPVFWSTGACLAVRKSAYDRVGGLDPQFFAHMEEIDLCWRFMRNGYANWVEPKSVVYHVGGGTLSSVNSKKTYLNFRNNLILLSKNLPSRRIAPTIFVRLVLDGLAGIQFLLKGQPSHVVAILKAHFHFYGRMGRIRASRKGQSFPWPVEGIYHQSIVRKSLVEGVKKFSKLPSESFFRS